jgi:hypothetical protein
MLSNADLEEISMIAGLRWPTEVVAGSMATWSEWRKSLERFEFRDVMAAVILLGETSDRFPSLARLRLGIDVVLEERERTNRPLLDPPVQAKPTTVQERLAAFDRSNGGEPMGPIERRAREELAKGGNPGDLAKAFLLAFSETRGQIRMPANDRSVVDLT